VNPCCHGIDPQRNRDVLQENIENDNCYDANDDNRYDHIRHTLSILGDLCLIEVYHHRGKISAFSLNHIFKQAGYKSKTVRGDAKTAHALPNLRERLLSSDVQVSVHDRLDAI